MKANTRRLTFFFFRGGEIKKKETMIKILQITERFSPHKKQSEVIYGEIPSFKVGVM